MNQNYCYHFIRKLNNSIIANHPIMTPETFVKPFKHAAPAKLRGLLIIFMMSLFPLAALCQQPSDQDLVIQKCIDMNEIQGFFPKKADNTYKHVYILQFPIMFEGNSSVTKFGQPVSFLERSELNGIAPDAYISFQKLNIKDNTAEAVFNFSYNRFAAEPHVVTMNLNLQKNAGQWTIINTTSNKL